MKIYFYPCTLDYFLSDSNVYLSIYFFETENKRKFAHRLM